MLGRKNSLNIGKDPDRGVDAKKSKFIKLLGLNRCTVCTQWEAGIPVKLVVRPQEAHLSI